MKYDKQAEIDGLKRTIEQNEEKIIEYSKPCDARKRRIRALERDLLKKKNKELRRKAEELEDDGRVKEKVNAVYNWTVEDGKPQPPQQDLPQAVKDRADYFWEMAEDGMTFMGAMECIFADEKPTDYDLGATKGWLPKSKEFDDWVGYSPGMSQVVIAVYLIYGGN
ncbi:gp24 domain protein [Streptococcus pneumoniae GA41277]|nr:gp24 domain protein [Streptococcus pneumoniae GA41277]